MRILLVSPRSDFPDITPGWLRIPQLSLHILAALTDPEHEVSIVEEEYEPMPLGEHWDVVGITVMTATALRAYELASIFRSKGVKVVLGGIHPSVLPEEAAEHSDAVVVGEAEGIWPKVLYDITHDQLKKFYFNLKPDISTSPLPLRKKARPFLGLTPYVMPVMASRGCPYDCEFCSVYKVYGRSQRHIPVERIVEDIKQNEAKRVMFLDDNIGGAPSYAMSLFQALKPLKIRWSGQASIRFILNDELFKAALCSGLEGLFVGVESVESDAKMSMRKSLDSIELYEKAIKRCHSTGVIFHASLIFGLDEETQDVFENTLDFLMRNSIHSVSPNILTPYPGTRLFERLKGEGRILHTNWSYYDHATVCYQPKNMQPEEMAEKYLEFRRNFFSYFSIVRRVYYQLRVAPLISLGINYAQRKTTKILEEHYRRYFHWLYDERNREKDLPLEFPMDSKRGVS